MRHFRKVMTLVVAALMALVVATPAWAADGTGTLTVTNATGGQTYTAYKVFNAVYADDADPEKGVVYTVPADLESKVSAPFSVSTAKASNEEKIIVRAEDADDAAVIAWMKANYSKFDSNGTVLTLDEAKGIASADLPYGYYYVSSSLGTVITIDSLHDDVKVVDKNESSPNGPEKKITAEDSAVNGDLDQTGITVDENNASVASVESFSVDFDAVNWVQADEDDTTAGTGTGAKTKVNVYSFSDTPTGLDIDTSTIKVYVNWDTDAQAEITSTISNPTKSDAGVVSFTIPWVNANGEFRYAAQTAGSELIPVHVTYNATVTDAAATAVATNEVKIKYNNDNNIEGTGTTTTYTYKFNLAKTDGANDALDGAEFQLFYAAEANSTTPVGEVLRFTKASDGAYHFDPEGTVTNIAPTGDDATALIVGLDDANYVLQEVVVPDGFNKAADQAVGGLSRVDATDEITTITVVNQKGTELPSTGGMGTTILYVVGGIMVAGAAIYLLTKKRASNM